MPHKPRDFGMWMELWQEPLYTFFKNRGAKKGGTKRRAGLPPSQSKWEQTTPYPDPRSPLLPSTSLRSTVAEQNKRLSGFEVEMWDLCAGQSGGLLAEDSLNTECSGLSG